MKKKQILIIAVWIAFLILASVLLGLLENHLCTKSAHEELLASADMVARKLPGLLENDIRSDMTFYGIRDARMNAVSLALEDADTVGQAKKVLDEVCPEAGMKGLALYDKDRKLVYGYGDYKGFEFDEVFAQQMNELTTDDYFNYILSNPDYTKLYCYSPERLEDDFEAYGWATKDGRWIMLGDFAEDETEDRIFRYFRWNSILPNIRIGSGGFAVGVDSEGGKILSFPDDEIVQYMNEDVTALGIKPDDSGQVATLEDLKETFADPNKIVRLSFGNQKYDVVSAPVDSVMILLFYPVREIHKKAGNSIATHMILIFLITGIGVLYMVFHLDDGKNKKIREFKHFVLNKSLFDWGVIVAILSIVLTVVFGIFLEALIQNAEIYNHNRTKVNAVSDLLRANELEEEALDEYMESDYLRRGEIAATVLNSAKTDITADYLKSLSDSLNVRYIYLFDTKGDLVVTNSPNEKISIKENSPFYPLLQGKKEIIGDLEKEEDQDVYSKLIGISLLDSEGKVTGALLLEADASEIEKIKDNLGYDSILYQIHFAEDTLILILNEDLEYRFSAIVDNEGETVYYDAQKGYADSYYDFSVFVVDEKNKERIHDDYNGTLVVNDTLLLTSIRRMNDEYILVVRNKMDEMDLHFACLFFEFVSTILFEVLLLLLSCIEKKKDAIYVESIENDVTEENTEEENAESGNIKKDDILAVLASLANKEKPYFEERWALDCLKWKDRSADEKFNTSLVNVFIIALAAIILQAVFTGEQSIWYYCLFGQWASGINLHSITSCVIIICIILVAKLVIHKILYLIARVANARVETMCYHFDSMLGYILCVIAIVLCLYYCGVNVKTLSLTGGVAGVIFGIGCQNIVADILAGILMCLEGVANDGDFVMYNGNPNVILSIGVRTTRLRWFGEVTIVRNNDFKNFVDYPPTKKNREIVYLTIDLKESLERVESILDKELPLINERLNEICEVPVTGPKYRGVGEINENGVELSFAIFCKSSHCRWVRRQLYRELKFMCERNGINLAMHQIVMNEPEEYPALKEEDDE